MNLKEQLNHAIEIAISAHEGQLDTNNGRPYIEHPFRVMNAGQTLQEKIVGVLHDVIEDTPWTLEQLRAEGFSEEIVEGVDAMSRRDNESYDEYLLRVEKNDIATRVKINDLSDNMDIRRWNEVPYQELARLQKYLKAYKQLTEREKSSKSHFHLKNKSKSISFSGQNGRHLHPYSLLQNALHILRFLHHYE